jgi:hypothetical protein
MKTGEKKFAEAHRAMMTTSVVSLDGLVSDSPRTFFVWDILQRYSIDTFRATWNQTFDATKEYNQ